MSGRTGLGELNLAREPFLNQRPVRRFSLLAWVLGLALLALNVVLWVGYRRDSTDLRTRLAAARADVESVSAEVVDLAEGLDTSGLAAHNARIEFLNQRLAERTFPWSRLFERLGGILPAGVRLASLTPSFASVAGEKVRSRETVDLRLIGSARSGEDLYAFLQTLFDDPAFDEPRLYNEDVAEGLVSFRMDVRYHPGVGAEGPE